MPGYPLRNACVRPLWLMGRLRSKAKQKQKRGGVTAGLSLGLHLNSTNEMATPAAPCERPLSFHRGIYRRPPS
ncbi:protein of unknown function [Pseudomonas mediterranea]